MGRLLRQRRRRPASSFSGSTPAVTENVFGLTPGARRVMTIGMIVMAGMIFWTMFKLGKPARPLDRNSVHTAVNAARQIHNGPAVFHGAGNTAGTPRGEAQRLAAMDPVDARCFATERYSVGDRGLRPIGEPDPRLVEAFINGPVAGSGDVVLERYLALKERSVRAVSAAQPADLQFSAPRLCRDAQDDAHGRPPLLRRGGPAPDAGRLR